MTDPTSPQPESAQPHDGVHPVPPVPPVASAPPVPPVPPAPSYESAPYVAPSAPAYESAYAPPAYAPATYTPPAYAAPPAYAPPQGYPVQTAPGAPPAVSYAYGGGIAAPRTNGLAIAAMILSIVGFVGILPIIGALAGTIMGHISLGQIKRTGDAGRGIALAGVIVGWAGLAVCVIVAVLVFLFVFAVSSASVSRYGY